jgi:hypothetical protein
VEALDARDIATDEAKIPTGDDVWDPERCKRLVEMVDKGFIEDELEDTWELKPLAAGRMLDARETTAEEVEWPADDDVWDPERCVEPAGMLSDLETDDSALLPIANVRLRLVN